MRRLILFRHAKSSWDNADAADHDRPLAPRGRIAAPAMGAWLAGRSYFPDHVLLSTSARTRETWDLARPALPGAPAGSIVERLYHADPATMLTVLRTAPANAVTVAMIGHQPGIGGFARKLADGKTPASCARAFKHFPTAAVAVLEFDIDDWSDAAWRGARFTAFACPRELA